MSWSQLRDRLPRAGGLSDRAATTKDQLKSQVKAGASAGHDSFGDRLGAGSAVIRKGLVAWANEGEKFSRWAGMLVSGFIAVPVALSDLRFIGLAVIGAVGSAWWFGKPGREFPTQPAAVLPPQAGDQWAGLVPDANPQVEAPAAPMLVVGQPGAEDPFPLAAARSLEEIARCVAVALKAEGVKVRGVEPPTIREWGKQVAVTQSSGTTEDIGKVAHKLETLLGLHRGRLIVTPAQPAGRTVLTMLESDPFEGMPPAPHRLPLSLSIKDAHVVARRFDGPELRLSLLGLHGVVIGKSGAGKSETFLSLADVASACVDAIVWDADPQGSGLDELGAAVARKARTPGEIEQMLADAVRMAEARPKLFTRLRMRKSWNPSSTHPAVLLFADEFIYLSDRAKELAIQLLRVGRKARVQLILAAQEGTEDALGDSIGSSVGLKIMHACREQDLPLILGSGKKAEGWRPDRLEPGDEHHKRDAGKCFIAGPGADAPVLYQVHQCADPERAGVERGAAGLPQIDEDTLTASGVRLAGGGRALSLAERVLTSEHADAGLLAALLDLFAADQYRGEEWLPTMEVLIPALAQAGHPVTPHKLRLVVGGDGKDKRTWRGSTSKVAGYPRAAVEAAAEGLTNRI